MKRSNIISRFFSVLLSLVFLAGSTGITMITHHCDTCNDYSVRSGLFLPPAAPEDDCCEAADTHCENEVSLAIETAGCCHFKIDKLKITSLAAPESYVFDGPEAIIPLTTMVYNEAGSNNMITYPVSVHNKHGGRYIITRNCQLLI